MNWPTVWGVTSMLSPSSAACPPLVGPSGLFVGLLVPGNRHPVQPRTVAKAFEVVAHRLVKAAGAPGSRRREPHYADLGSIVQPVPVVAQLEHHAVVLKVGNPVLGQATTGCKIAFRSGGQRREANAPAPQTRPLGDVQVERAEKLLGQGRFRFGCAQLVVLPDVKGSVSSRPRVLAASGTRGR